jgi:hypothetical protein
MPKLASDFEAASSFDQHELWQVILMLTRRQSTPIHTARTLQYSKIAEPIYKQNERDIRNCDTNFSKQNGPVSCTKSMLPDMNSGRK